MKKAIIASILITSSIILFGCNKEEPQNSNNNIENTTVKPQSLSDTDINNAKNTIEEYFKYASTKDYEIEKNIFSKVYLESHGSIDKNDLVRIEYINNLDYLKVLSLEKDDNPNYEYGLEKNPLNKITIKATYEVKNKDDTIAITKSGIHTWWFKLIREGQNSPWGIADMGM